MTQQQVTWRPGRMMTGVAAGLAIALTAGTVHGAASAAAKIVGKKQADVASRQELAPGVTMATLTHGLTVIIEESHATRVCSVRFYVKNTGSVYEDRMLGVGVSHVLEHLVSGGTTKRRKEAEFKRAIDRMGGNNNAFTSYGLTGYYINAASRHVDTCIDLLSDMAQNCIFAEEEYKREMGVVQRELERGKANRRRVLWQLNGQNLYGDHPASHPIIGYADVLARVSRDEIADFYRRRYVPDNIAMVVTGDVDTKQVLARVRRAWAGATRRVPKPIYLPPPKPVTGPRRAFREMDGKLVDFVLSFPTVELTHPDLYALDVLSYILSEGESARLPRIVKREKQLVIGISSSSYTPAYAPGSLSVFATAEPAQFDEATGAILEELYRLRNERVTETELAKAKKQKAADYVFYRQRASDRADDLARNWVYTGDPLFSRQYVDEIQKVTADEVQQVARKYLVASRLCTGAVVPFGKLPRETAGAEMVKTPTVRHVTLPNGLNVLIRRSPAVPLVAIQAYFRAGVLVEDEKTNGLSTLASRLLVKGTRKHDAQQIAQYFDSIGGKISSAGGYHTGFLTVEVLKDDFDEALGFVAEMVREPTFPQAEIDRLKKITIAGIRNREAHWQTELDDLMRANLPRNTPYRFKPSGTVESVTALTRDDLVRFHKAYCVSNNMVLAVYGDIDAAAAEAAVRKLFGPMKPAEKLHVVPDAGGFRLETTRRVTKTTNKTIAAVSIVFPTTKLKQYEDNWALTTLFAIMAGYYAPGGWLFEELRGQGLVYDVHGYNFEGVVPRYGIIRAQCEPDKVDEVIKRIQDKLEAARVGKIAPADLAEARQRVLAFEEIKDQTNSQQAQRAALDQLYGLGYDYRRRQLRGIRQVQLADVKRVARKYLDKFLICVTTPGEKKGRSKKDEG